MVKTIKFNLICDGYSVRTIEDLQNHFSIEDIISYYHNNLLQRWLLVRGYTSQLEAVKKIDSEDDLKIISKLIEVFEIETEQSVVEKSIYILQYKKLAEKQVNDFKKNQRNLDREISNYHKEYVEVVSRILENPTNVGIIKASVQTLNEKYLSILMTDYENLFYVFKGRAPLALFILLTFERTRALYLKPDSNDDESKENFIPRHLDLKSLKKELSVFSDNRNISNPNSSDAAEMAIKALLAKLPDTSEEEKGEEEKEEEVLNWVKPYKPWTWAQEAEEKESESDELPVNDSIKVTLQHNLEELEDLVDERQSKFKKVLTALNTPEKLQSILGDNLKVFSDTTDSYWKDLETSEHEYMIFTMGSRSMVRSAGNRNQELKSTDINENFVILKGIDYSNNYASNTIYYMEV